MRKLLFISLWLFAFSCKEEEKGTDPGALPFVKRESPVWQGQWTAADPFVIRDGDTLRMYYPSYVVDTKEKLVIAGAKSVDSDNEKNNRLIFKDLKYRSTSIDVC